MSLHRSVVAAALAATLLTAGCSDDSSADPTPVTAGPTTAVDPTTTAGIESTTTVADAATSTTSASPTSPPVTKPLTTAPPSELLTEVTAAYDAAWVDIRAAGSLPDPESPSLSQHLAGPQLDQWRTVIRSFLVDGTKVVAQPDKSWARVESLDLSADGVARLEVCRLDADLTVRSATGETIEEGAIPGRYLDEMRKVDGSWKWWSREWIDSDRERSDCERP